MNTILYRIPDKYFPAVTVKKPFHAKVNYDYNQGIVKILDVALSPLCLTHIDNTKAMVKQMKEDIEKAEKKKVADTKEERDCDRDKDDIHPLFVEIFEAHFDNGPTGHGDVCYSDADSGL